jgi:hypothetical protein
VAAALVACLALAGLFFKGTPEPADESPVPAAAEPARPESPPKPLAMEARPAERAPPAKAPVPIEGVSAPMNPHHFQAMLALARARQDAVDDCRDRIRLPPVDKLLPWSTVVIPPADPFRPNPTVAEEISMEQNIVFEIAASADGYRLLSASVVETWLEFPGRDGSRRRAPFSDASLDRCVERALAGATADSPGAVAGERFLVQGRAGEAVYDLR